MTGREFSEVDIDLLADYVGGALDGTPDESAVARRVADDPAWAEAYASLAGSVATVQADLAAWGGTPEPMPADVTDRIATALEQEPRRPALLAVPDADGPRRTVTRPRRRWPAWATPAAIAAGVAVFAGFGLSQLGSSGTDDAGSSTEAPAAARDNAAGAEAAPTQQQLMVSGRDYRAATLATEKLPAPGARTLNEPPTAAQQDTQLKAAAPLQRLTDPAALKACLDAIARDHDRSATVVEVVDLASFDGSPAVVVFFTDDTGARWVWASGPNCGQVAWGADTRGNAKIG